MKMAWTEDAISYKGNYYQVPAPHDGIRGWPVAANWTALYGAPGELDAFQWACPACAHVVHRVEVQVQAIDQDLPPLFAAFHDDPDARTCPNCGALHPGREGRL